jgi:hypothetical protein
MTWKQIPLTATTTNDHRQVVSLSSIALDIVIPSPTPHRENVTRYRVPSSAAESVTSVTESERRPAAVPRGC